MNPSEGWDNKCDHGASASSCQVLGYAKTGKIAKHTEDDDKMRTSWQDEANIIWDEDHICSYNEDGE